MCGCDKSTEYEREGGLPLKQVVVWIVVIVVMVRAHERVLLVHLDESFFPVLGRVRVWMPKAPAE